MNYMKLINKFLYMVAAVASLFATSCMDQIQPEPLPTLEGNQVYFAIDQQTKFSIADAQEFDITVYRLVADADYTPTIRYDEVDGIELTLPSFLAGEKEAILHVTCDKSKFAVGETKTISIKISDNLSEYGLHEITLQVVLPEPWNNLEGYGTYVDDFLAPFLEFPSGYKADVKFQQSATDANRYRVVNPYGGDTMFQLIGGTPGYFIYDDVDDYIEFDLTNKDDVKIIYNGEPSNIVPAGFQVNFSDVGALDIYLVISSDENGNYLEPIKCVDNVIRFPKDNVEFIYIYDNEAYGMAVNPTGKMAFALPGAVVADYTLEVEYSGMIVDALGVNASAILDFTVGEDVERFRFAILEGDQTADYAATVEGIVNETLEGVISATATETSHNIALTTGMYTVVAVPYGKDGAVASSAVAYRFYFTGSSAERPEVEIGITVGSIVDITGNPQYEAAYPSATSMCIYMQADGTQIKSITAYVSSGVPADIPNEDLLAGGQDLSGFIPDMVENGYALAVYTGLTEGTTYDIILGFVTIYGELKTFRTTYTPTAATTPEEGGDENPEEGGENEGGENEGGENVNPEEGGEEEETPAEPSRFKFRTFEYSGN